MNVPYDVKFDNPRLNRKPYVISNPGLDRRGSALGEPIAERNMPKLFLRGNSAYLLVFRRASVSQRIQYHLAC